MDKNEAYELGLDRGKAIATDMDLLAEVLVDIDATNRYECPACGEGYIDKGMMIVGKVERQVCDGHNGCSATFTTFAGLPDYIHNMHVQRAHIIEETDRQFSPFEHTAHTFNTAADPDCNHDSMLQCPQCSYVTKAYNDHMGEIVSLDCPSCSTISDIDDCTIDYCDNCEWYQDELWNRFESGINDGIESVLRERLGLEEATMQ